MKPLSSWNKAAVIYTTLVITPALASLFFGCFTQKNALFSIGWVCKDHEFIILNALIFFGATLTLRENARTKLHSIFWYVIGGGTVVLIAAFWLLARIFSDIGV